MVRTRVGYAGGTKHHPTYHDLGDHTESIEIVYDPAVLTYEALLGEFWQQHDPHYASGSRQYRAAAMTQSPDQERIARASKEALGYPAATSIEPLTTFTPAEDYHQKYYLRRSREIVQALIRLTGDERAFMDTTAAARLNAYFGGACTAADVAAELAALGLDAPTVDGLMTRIRRAAGDR